MDAHALWITAGRAAAVYAFMLVVIRLLGKRTVGNFSAFDLLVALMLGEVVDAPHSLTLRTSIVGRELRGCNGLFEWFLSQRGARVLRLFVRQGPGRATHAGNLVPGGQRAPAPGSAAARDAAQDELSTGHFQ